MPNLNNVEKGLERLLKIKWEIDNSKTPSQIALMKEYLRRAALWADRVNPEEEWPFFDVGLYFAPDVRAPKEILDRMQEGLSGRGLSMRDSKTCAYYLHWMALCDAGRLEGIYLPEPYEPLIVFYERGGSFTVEHNFIEIGLLNPVMITNWRRSTQQPPLPSLDKEYLDQLDAAAEKPTTTDKRDLVIRA
jgi:hypothetical protein